MSLIDATQTCRRAGRCPPSGVKRTSVLVMRISVPDRRGRRGQRSSRPRRNGCADEMDVLPHSRIGALLPLRGQYLRRSPGPSSSPQRQSHARRVCVCEAVPAPLQWRRTFPRRGECRLQSACGRATKRQITLTPARELLQRKSLTSRTCCDSGFIK